MRALSLYQRVGKTEGFEIASSTYNLARLREKQLNLMANAPAGRREVILNLFSPSGKTLTSLTR